MVSGIGVVPNFNLTGQEKPLTFTSGSTPMSGKQNIFVTIEVDSFQKEHSFMLVCGFYIIQF